MKKYLTKILDCFFLLRIPLLAPVWTILILGWVTGNRECRPGGSFADAAGAGGSGGVLWLALVGFSLLVASIYVVNQIVDIESDRINHKLFLLPQGIISIPLATALAIICCAAGLGISFAFPVSIRIVFGLSLVLGVLYNLPPVTLKNHALGGVIANSLGHGMLTYLVGWYAAHWCFGAGPVDHVRGILSALSPGFANAAVFLATTIPDAAGDHATGKRTFCVAYGEKTTAISAALLCLLALGSALLMEFNRWIMIVPSALSLVLFGMFAFHTNRELAFKSFKWPVFLLTASVAVMVPVYGVLILITFFGSRLYYRRRFGIEYPTFKSQ
jgi:4-hydroxybenzoate polyprenyltransferase